MRSEILKIKKKCFVIKDRSNTNTENKFRIQISVHIYAGTTIHFALLTNSTRKGEVKNKYRCKTAIPRCFAQNPNTSGIISLPTSIFPPPYYQQLFMNFH